MTVAEIDGHLIFRQLGHYATDYRGRERESPRTLVVGVCQDIAAIALDPEGWLEHMRQKSWWTPEMELEAVLLTVAMTNKISPRIEKRNRRGTVA